MLERSCWIECWIKLPWRCVRTLCVSWFLMRTRAEIHVNRKTLKNPLVTFWIGLTKNYNGAQTNQTIYALLKALRCQKMFIWCANVVLNSTMAENLFFHTVTSRFVVNTKDCDKIDPHICLWVWIITGCVEVKVWWRLYWTDNTCWKILSLSVSGLTFLTFFKRCFISRIQLLWVLSMIHKILMSLDTLFQLVSIKNMNEKTQRSAKIKYE